MVIDKVNSKTIKERVREIKSNLNTIVSDLLIEFVSNKTYSVATFQ